MRTRKKADRHVRELADRYYAEQCRRLGAITPAPAPTHDEIRAAGIIPFDEEPSLLPAGWIRVAAGTLAASGVQLPQWLTTGDPNPLGKVPGRGKSGFIKPRRVRTSDKPPVSPPRKRGQK